MRLTRCCAPGQRPHYQSDSGRYVQWAEFQPTHPPSRRTFAGALEASLPIEPGTPQPDHHTDRAGSLRGYSGEMQRTGLFYRGMEGRRGIVRALDIGGRNTEAAHASITHLIFGRKVPLFSQINGYQRHRTKSERAGAAAMINSRSKNRSGRFAPAHKSV